MEISICKHYEVSNFYGLPKIHKYKFIESTINTQISKTIEFFEKKNLKLKSIVSCPKSLLEN